MKASFTSHSFMAQSKYLFYFLKKDKEFIYLSNVYLNLLTLKSLFKNGQVLIFSLIFNWRNSDNHSR